MNLNLTRNIVFFDIESTGLNVLRDRIIQLALVRYQPNEPEPIEKVYLINPKIPISPEAAAVHGITYEDIKDKPSFDELANEIFEFIGDADLAGYNSNRFDVPLLMEEFARAGIDFELDNRRTIDVQRIFYKMEPRTLAAAYKFYCNQTLTNAHDALVDVRATVEVLDGQLKAYEEADFESPDGEVISRPIKNDVRSLDEFTNDLNIVDVTQRLRYDSDGTIVFNFGKYMGKPVAEILTRDKQYYQWMLDKEFSFQVKKIIKNLVEDFEKNT